MCNQLVPLSTGLFSGCNHTAIHEACQLWGCGLFTSWTSFLVPVSMPHTFHSLFKGSRVTMLPVHHSTFWNHRRREKTACCTGGCRASTVLSREEWEWEKWAMMAQIAFPVPLHVPALLLGSSLLKMRLLIFGLTELFIKMQMSLNSNLISLWQLMGLAEQNTATCRPVRRPGPNPHLSYSLWAHPCVWKEKSRQPCFSPLWRVEI